MGSGNWSDGDFMKNWSKFIWLSISDWLKITIKMWVTEGKFKGTIRTEGRLGYVSYKLIFGARSVSCLQNWQLTNDEPSKQLWTYQDYTYVLDFKLKPNKGEEPWPSSLD